jgi:hypothetical protein
MNRTADGDSPCYRPPSLSDDTIGRSIVSDLAVLQQAPFTRALARLGLRTRDRKLSALHRHPLLTLLRRRDIRLLGSYADSLTFPAGARIVVGGNRPSFCYLFHAGTVIGATGAWTLPSDAIMVGLHATLASRPHAESVMAGSELHGYAMDARYADWLVSRSPRLLHTPPV